MQHSWFRHLAGRNRGRHDMKRKLGLTAGILALAIAGAAHAQSSDDQAACRSDAMKYCSSHIGKQDEMRKCIASNKDKLSAACKAVVEKRGG